MGDGQDHQDIAKDAPVQGEIPWTEPVDGAQEDRGSAHLGQEDARYDDGKDGTGLTGVLAALSEPEPEGLPAESEQVAADVEPVEGVADNTDAEMIDPQIAALQAELDGEVEAQEVPDDEPEVEKASAESLDDIAPGTVGGEQEAHEDAKGLVLPDDRAGLPIWPFLVYFALWVIFAGLLVWQFMQAPVGTPVYELEVYGISVLIGLVLTAIGPLLAIAVWLAVWQARPRGASAGLFSRCLIIGAVTTLAGVALWLIALGAVDMLRLGRLL